MLAEPFAQFAKSTNADSLEFDRQLLECGTYSGNIYISTVDNGVPDLAVLMSTKVFNRIVKPVRSDKLAHQHFAGRTE